MATQIVGDFQRIFAFVNARVPVFLSEGMKALGLERDGELVAGVLYEGYTGANVWMHIAVDGGQLSREFLRYMFYYPFIELGCARISSFTPADNAAARRFNEHVGASVEATLPQAGPGGGDLCVYVMWRETCRFLPGRVGARRAVHG